MNTPVQGSAADLIKKAMIDLHRELARRGAGGAARSSRSTTSCFWRCPRPRPRRASALVKEVMEGPSTLDVPLVADARVGPQLGRGSLIETRRKRQALTAAGTSSGNIHVTRSCAVPLYEYECADVRALRGDSEVLRPAAQDVPDVRQADHEALLVPRHPIQGRGLVRHRLRQEVPEQRVEVRRVGGGVEGIRRPLPRKRLVLDRHPLHHPKTLSAPSTTTPPRKLCQWQQPLEVRRREVTILPRRKPPRATGGSLHGRIDPGPVPVGPRASELEGLEVGAEGRAQVGALQGELDRGLQEAELVAGVVADPSKR